MTVHKEMKVLQGPCEVREAVMCVLVQGVECSRCQQKEQDYTMVMVFTLEMN
jgi:hypothetical protein